MIDTGEVSSFESAEKHATNAIAYETLRKRHLQDMRSRIPQVMQRLTWSAEQLKVERERRLREMLRIAKTAGASGVLVDYDPRTQQYAAASAF